MTAQNILLIEQLKEACKVAKARWATWVQRSDSGWEFSVYYGFNKTRLAALSVFIGHSRTASWLAGAFSSGRVRTRQTGTFSEELGCERVYLFPNLNTRCALLVGADHLEKLAESFFKVLAMNSVFEKEAQAGPAAVLPQIALDEISYLNPLEAALEVSYDPVGILENVLEYLAVSLSCDAALMSIRSGDIFRVEVVWKCPEAVRGTDISIRENRILAEMTVSRQGLIRGDIPSKRGDRRYLGFGEDINELAEDWMILPIVIGQRVIGHLTFISRRRAVFSQADLQRITKQVGRLAYVVENAIVFTEAARYLQQFALLNELASAASLGVDTHEVAHRVMQRLKRTFHTDLAGVFMFSQDGRLLREYGAEPVETTPLVIPVENSLVGQVVESGMPVRIGDLHHYSGRSNYFESDPAMNSELAVPLKYRGKVIGALALLSTTGNAFSQQDEQLLVVIASHLAGLFENMRLNEETRQRAHNLNLIHQVVRKVVGVNDLLEITKVAAELMVKRFSYEMASVILLDENARAMVVKEKSGAGTLQFIGEKALCVGVSGQVLEDGVSRLINDVSREPSYVSLPDWQAGSEMCVPLRGGERILGVIDVERSRKHAFSENDLLALEALAGVMSSVVLSALRYRQLQDSVRQLQAVRETALDIAGDLELDAVLKRVVLRARELVGVKGAELGLLDEKEQVVRVLVSETPWANTRGEDIPLMAGVAGRVAAFGEPLVVADYNNWNGRLYPDQKAPFRSVAGIPLKFQGQVIGALTLIDDRPDWVFKPQHVQLLELFAPQVTVWIRNARLYQELQERIQAQRSAENRLIRSARLAAVGEMAAGVAHELNNPLTTIAGFAELILEEIPVDSPHRADLELILKESLRARGVVRRLLDFSRQAENRRVRTDLNELVGDVVTLVNHLARTGGVEIHVELGENLSWVSVDPAQIKQVLLNLVHNAIQAMPGGGLLKVITSRISAGAGEDKRDWTTVSVIDSGEGISQDNLDRLFEPFFTTRPAGKGTGLGLSVSYGIVADHGGYIDVESQLGKGSCFTVFLPYESEASFD